MRTPLALLGVAVVVAAVVVALASFGLGGSPSPAASPSSAAMASPAAQPTQLWSAPPDPLARAVAAGLQPAPKEHLANHSHAHLDGFIDGKPIVVPAGIGINIADPAVRHFEDPIGYGGIELCAQPCISPLHTHDETGILHTESLESKPNTLGEFYTEWGVELSDACVATYCDPMPIDVYIDGAPFDGDPRSIELRDRMVIVIVVGTPPAVIPKTADPSAA